MICYRDMTFCTHYEDCGKANDCHRPLTEEVKKAAATWWKGGDGAPISTFVEMPDCHTKAPPIKLPKASS